MPEKKTRRLAAIMFADIVGYTAMMQRNESEGLAKVNHFRQVMEKQVAGLEGELIKFLGDGYLCIFYSAVQAMHAAQAIQRDLQSEPSVPLRIGIHIGDIVIQEGNVYGDGVNLASRVESMGVPGSILVTERVIHDLKNHPEFELTSLGRFNFKNVEKSMEVFALANEGFVVPKKGDIQGKLKPAKSIIPSKWLSAAITVLVISLIGLFMINQNQKKNIAFLQNKTDFIEEIPHNSIAILPFSNRSDNKENQYFTDGIHEDLRTHLSKIGSMKVISKTSVNFYRNTMKTSSEIGKELTVANLLQGSVRRTQSQVRLNVQLIQANTGEQLWSEIYDRELSTHNIFDIQTEIALEIASVLKTVITPEQQQALTQLPTENLEAYEHYLRALQLMEVRNSESLFRAIELFKKAIELDREFAIAYIHLGSVHALLPFYANADADTHFQIAWNYLEKGMALNDHMAEAHALKAYLISFIQNDLELAIPSFEKAISINPNFETAYLWYAFAVQRLTNDSQRALNLVQKALRLNPLSPAILWNQANFLKNTGDLAKALNVHRKGISIEPEYAFFWISLSTLYRHQLGELDSAAIYAFQGIKQNSPQDLYLHNYLTCLENLEMLSEMEATLDQSTVKNRQDSIIYLVNHRELAFIKKDFNTVLQLNRQLKHFGDWRNNSNILTNLYGSMAEFAAYYYQREFTKVVDVFETNYPDSSKGVKMNFNQRIFLEYIHSLRQIDQHQKADKLMETYKPHFADAKGWTSVCYNIITGNGDEGLQQLALLYKNKFYLPWQYVDYNPILDSERSTQSYQKFLSELQSKIAIQRASFQSYLASQN